MCPVERAARNDEQRLEQLPPGMLICVGRLKKTRLRAVFFAIRCARPCHARQLKASLPALAQTPSHHENNPVQSNTGTRVPTPLKPSGRSRSASIESAAEFFSSQKAHRPGDQHNDDGSTPAAAAKSADAGANNSGGAGGLSNGSSARKRQRDEAGGASGDDGEAARLGGAVKGRVPRKHQEQRRGLPIFAHKAGIIRAVKEHQVRDRSTPAGVVLRGGRLWLWLMLFVVVVAVVVVVT